MLTKDPYRFVYLSVPKDVRKANLENDKNGMVILNAHNAAITKTLIDASGKARESKPHDYFNSIKGGCLSSYSTAELYELIKLIVSANSTRTPNLNVKILADYIADNMDSFIERLKNHDFALVDELANLKELARRERSLASKICRYLEEWIYGTDYFAINDSVVRAMLPYYLMEYGLNYKVKLDEMTYPDFMKVFNELKAAVKAQESTLTAHMIDNIIWYVYRLDTVRTTIADAMVKASIAAKRQFP